MKRYPTEHPFTPKETLPKGIAAANLALSEGKVYAARIL
jgi:hypothetical protein